jgi:hypothetical protein
MRNILLIGLLFTLIIASCIKDKNPPIPAYIYVPSFQLTNIDVASQGSANHNFTDVWISVDGQIIGANNIPTILPTMIADTATSQIVKVYPGIEKNGISSSRTFYPFMDAYEITLDLKQGKVDTVYPVFSYNPLAQFKIIDDFEGPGVAFGEDLDLYPDSYMTNQSIVVFEGQGAGQLIFDTLSPVCYVGTSADFSGLQSSTVASHVYLEFHYNTNIPVVVGLVAKKPGSANQYFDKGGVNSSEGNWKKIYFVLTEDIYSLNAQSYQVYFKSGLSFSDTITPKVYLDNIKFVHY